MVIRHPRQVRDVVIWGRPSISPGSQPEILCLPDEEIQNQWAKTLVKHGQKPWKWKPFRVSHGSTIILDDSTTSLDEPVLP